MAVDKRGRKLPRGIRQRGDKYEGRFMVNGINHSVTGKTIKEVQKLMVDERYKAEHGTYLRPESVTVDQWYKHWQRVYDSHWKQTTLDGHASMYRVHIQPVFGGMLLTDIRREDIRAWLTKLDGEYAAGMVQHIRSILDRMLAAAVEENLLEVNPMPKVLVRQKRQSGDRIALTVAQQKLFLDYAAENYYYPIFVLQLKTGMRVGEVIGLRKTDLDFDKSTIHVRRTLQRTSAGRLEQTPKTKAGNRTIPMNPDVKELLAYHCEISPDRRSDGHVFCRANGRTIDSQCVNDAIKFIVGLIRANGFKFPDITSHVFRHTFATRAIEAGMSPQTLKTILGHTSLSMTMDLYSHVMEDTKAAEMALLMG